MRRLAFYAFRASLCKRTSCRIHTFLISSVIFSAIPELKKFFLRLLNPFKLRIAHFVTCSPYTSQVSCLSLFHVVERNRFLCVYLFQCFMERYDTISLLLLEQTLQLLIEYSCFRYDLGLC